MSRLTIIYGKPGSGKTTLANALSKKLQTACLHKDSFKESLYDQLNGQSLDDSMRIGKASIFLLFDLAEEQIRRDVDLIIEAPFNFSEDYKRFENWQEEFGIEIFSIKCTINEKERKKRFKTRKRHKCHHDEDRELFKGKDSSKSADYSTMPGKRMTVVTNKDVSTLIREIIPFLNSK